MESVALDFGAGGGEVQVYFDRRNLDQMDAALKASEDGHVELIVVNLIMRAKLESGAMMFSNSDRKKIRKEFDPEAVLDFTIALNKFDRSGDEKAGN